MRGRSVLACSRAALVLACLLGVASCSTGPDVTGTPVATSVTESAAATSVTEPAVSSTSAAPMVTSAPAPMVDPSAGSGSLAEPAPATATPADVSLTAGEPQLTPSFVGDVGCKFEVTIQNEGPDDATGVELVASVNGTGEAGSIVGVPFPGPSTIPAGSTAQYGGRLGMVMSPGSVYFLEGHVNVEGDRALDFSSRFAKQCP